MSKVVKIVKDAVDSIGDALENLADAVVDAVQFVWDEVAMPVLEEVFSWFGIVDEYVINASKTSVKIFDDSQDNYKDSLTRSVLANLTNDASFYQNYMYEVNRNKAQIRAQYVYIRNGRHTHNLPKMTISGGNVDLAAVGTALDSVKGGTNVVIDTQSYLPSNYLYFQDQLQAAPENYKPYANSLTYANEYGQVFDDWSFNSAVYNPSGPHYDLSISRVAELAIFWLEGDTNVVEGDSAQLTVKCNRPIPSGETATITLAYSGTAVDGTDYTSSASVDILSGTQETTFTIPTIENATSDSPRVLTVTAASVDNSNQMFEAVAISPTEDSISISIVDDDTVILTMSNIRVSESATSVTIPVKLEAATSPFTVDFALSNITAIKGVDYEDISGTLSFSGTEGEIQNIVVGITADVVNDDYEQFLVSLTNSSDPSIDISLTSVVTIVDGTDVNYPAGTSSDSQVIVKPDYARIKKLVVQYYSDSDTPGEWYYWLYDYSDNTYPDLDETADRVSDLEMLPTIMLRNDKVNVNDDKTSEVYKSTKTLLRFMGIDVDSFVDTINENPDIDLVDDAFIYFGVSPLDTHPAVSKMLYLIWEEIIVKYQISSAIKKFHASYEVDDMIKNSVVWTEHTMEDVVESSTMKVGTYSHEIDGEYLRIYYRVNSTTTTTISVKNLNSVSLVSAIIDGQLYDKSAPNTLTDADFSIPVSWHILNSMTSKEVAQLFPFIFRMEFYAASITEIAWYQTDAFMLVLRLVQVVVTIFFWYAGGGTWTQLAFDLITQYAVAEFIVLGIDVLLKITGNKDLAIAFAAIAAVAFRGNFNVSFINPADLLEMSIQFSRNIAQLYDTKNVQIQDAMDFLETEYEDRQQEIDSVADSLESGVSTEYITYLNSVDTNIETAVGAQYNYDYNYSYDIIISDFCDNKLKVGVI